MANLDTDTNITPSTSHDDFSNQPRVDFDSRFEAAQSPSQYQPPGGQETFYRKGLDQGRRLFSGASSGLRSHVNANPWMDIGIVAVACLAVGYFFGTRSRSTWAPDGQGIGVQSSDVDARTSEDLTIGHSY